MCNEDSKSALIKLSQYLLFLGLSGLPAQNTLAEDPTGIFNMDLAALLDVQVVTAAAGYEQTVSAIPVSTTVIDRAQWQASGATTLEDVLISVPGIHISAESLALATPVPDVRGISGGFGRNVKVLVDGIAFEDMGQGGNSFYKHPLINNLKQIEVVKGPGSVVYGADAIAGVVNLVSPDPGDSNYNHLNLRAGEDGHRDIAFAHGGGSENEILWYASMEYSESDFGGGPIVASDLQTVFDGAFGTEASLAPSRLSDQHKILNINLKVEYGPWSLKHFYHDGQGNARTGAANALDGRGLLEAVRSNTQLTYTIKQLEKYLPGTLTLASTFYYQDGQNRFDIFPPNSLFPVGDDGNLFSPGGGLVFFPDGVRGTPGTYGRRTDLQLTHQYRTASGHDLRTQFGMDNNRYRVTEVKNFGPGVLDNIVYPADGSPYIATNMVNVTDTPYVYSIPGNRRFWWLSFQDQWQASENLSFSLGIRYDKYNDFGSTTNPRLGLNWRLNEQWSVRAFYGSAFREPKFSELNLRNNPSARGNPDLRPETIDTHELGFRYQLSDNFHMGGAIYRYKTDDLIEALPVPGDSLRVYQNTDGTEGKGFELEARWQSQKLAINANYAYNQTEDRHGKTKPGNPKHLAYVDVYWPINELLAWHGGVKFVGDRERPSDDPRAELEDYTLVSSKLAWTLQKDWTLSWIINNAGDEDAREYMPLASGFSQDLPLNRRLHRLELEITY